MEHLGLEVFDRDGGNGQFANLPENASITINDNSDIFGSGDIWSYSFTLNIRANAHIFGSSGEQHGARLHDAVNKRRARLWVDGIALFYGFLLLEDDVDVDKSGNIRVSFGSGRKTFKTLIEGAKANQVPMMDDVPFGMALYRKRKALTTVVCKLSGTVHLVQKHQEMGADDTVRSEYIVSDDQIRISDTLPFLVETDGDLTPISEYPRMVFPRGTFHNRAANQDETLNYLNTEYPYDAQHPYCNIALCYQKSEYKKSVVDSGDDGEVEQKRAYTLMPADRVNSAPCFFVIYWILALMKHLNIRVDENQMMNVEDLRRLFFVNTNCAYDSPKSRGINKRTDCTHKIPSELVPEQTWGNVSDTAESRTTLTFKSVTQPATQDYFYYYSSYSNKFVYSDYLDKDSISVAIDYISWAGRSDLKKYNNYAHPAYASSKCFPNSDVSTVIESIESAFGIRFLFDRDYSSVRIILLRNVFRNSEVRRIAGDITNDGGKTESSVRGFRMTYGTSDNTHFYYKGFADALIHKTELWPDNSDTHDYSKWDLNAQYAEVLKKKSAFNLTCYVTPNNGNAWIVKNDEQAERLSEYYPEIFECAGFMDAEDGDCSGEDDTIHTVSVGFTPAIMNEISKTHKDGELRFALLCEDEMRPRRYNYKNPADDNYFSSPPKNYDVGTLFNVLGADGDRVLPGRFEVFSDMSLPQTYNLSFEYRKQLADNFCDLYRIPQNERLRIFRANFDASGYILEGYRLYLQDNFEPNDDGISPIEKHDWGLTLGILRGSGSDAKVQSSEDPDDGEGNVTWDIIPGKNVTAHPDTCDNYGNLWVHQNSHIIFTPEQAIGQMQEMFPNSNFNLADIATTAAHWLYLAGGIPDNDGNKHSLLLAVPDGMSSWEVVRHFRNRSVQDMWDYDSNGHRILIAVDATQEQLATLSKLRNIAKGSGESITIDGDGANAVWAQQNRVSLKLRAEKPNPKFDRTQPESDENRRYLKIENADLSGRGLCDQFYKEFSWWIRNGRTQKYTLRMELAQLLTLDKSVQVQVGDVTGFIKKMTYTVSNATGLGLVTMEILYI